MPQGWKQDSVNRNQYILLRFTFQSSEVTKSDRSLPRRRFGVDNVSLHTVCIRVLTSVGRGG